MSAPAEPDAPSLRARLPVTLKAAVTLDGRIATRTGDSKWITGEAARREAHVLRERAGAVMVGVGTVLADDPRLTLHMLGEGAKDPVRIVLDTHLRTPLDAKVVVHTSRAPTWIVHGPSPSAAARAAMARPGVELVEMPLSEGRIDLAWLLGELARRSIRSLLVEGGGPVHGAFLDADLADHMAVFVAPLVLGDRAARTLADMARPAHLIAQARRLVDVRTRTLGDDVLIEGRIARPRS